MQLRIFLAVVAFQVHQCYNCSPKRTKELTGSYVPACIQALYHYKTQLVRLYPYTFTLFCSKAGENIPLTTNVCVDETLSRINLFLIDLKREAINQNLEDFQGFTNEALIELEETSEMTSIQQLQFILRKLQKEKIKGKATKCKILEFIQDLDNPGSKLYRNFANVKSLNYLSWH